MSSLGNYRGLQVLTGGSPAAGGEAINNNFKALVDWRPKCNWDVGNVGPDGDNNESEEYHPGSFWLWKDTSGSPDKYKLEICVESSDSSARWELVASWNV